MSFSASMNVQVRRRAPTIGPPIGCCAETSRQGAAKEMRQKLAPANNGISAIASLAKPSPSDDRILGQITADAFRNRFDGECLTHVPGSPSRSALGISPRSLEEELQTMLKHSPPLARDEALRFPSTASISCSWTTVLTNRECQRVGAHAPQFGRAFERETAHAARLPRRQPH
jgi:hypothetical protein